MQKLPEWIIEAFSRWTDSAEKKFNELAGEILPIDKDVLAGLLIYEMSRCGPDEDVGEKGFIKRSVGIEWTESWLNATFVCPVVGRQVVKARVTKSEVKDDDKSVYINGAEKAVIYFTSIARAKLIMERFTWVQELINTSRMEVKEWKDCDFGKPTIQSDNRNRAESHGGLGKGEEGAEGDRPREENV